MLNQLRSFLLAITAIITVSFLLSTRHASGECDKDARANYEQQKRESTIATRARLVRELEVNPYDHDKLNLLCNLWMYQGRSYMLGKHMVDSAVATFEAIENYMISRKWNDSVGGWSPTKGNTYFQMGE